MRFADGGGEGFGSWKVHKNLLLSKPDKSKLTTQTESRESGARRHPAAALQVDGRAGAGLDPGG